PPAWQSGPEANGRGDGDPRQLETEIEQVVHGQSENTNACPEVRRRPPSQQPRAQPEHAAYDHEDRKWHPKLNGVLQRGTLREHGSPGTYIIRCKAGLEATPPDAHE